MQNTPQKKRKRLGLFLLVFFLITVSAFYLVFLNFAELSSYTLRTVLEGKGVQVNQLSLQRPGVRSLHLKDFDGTFNNETGSFVFSISGVDIPYSLLTSFKEFKNLPLGLSPLLSEKIINFFQLGHTGISVDILKIHIEPSEDTAPIKTNTLELPVDEKEKKKIFGHISDIHDQIITLLLSHYVTIKDLEISYGEEIKSAGLLNIKPLSSTVIGETNVTNTTNKNAILELILPEIRIANNTFHSTVANFETRSLDGILKEVKLALLAPQLSAELFDLLLPPTSLTLSDTGNGISLSLQSSVSEYKKNSISILLNLNEDKMSYTAQAKAENFTLYLPNTIQNASPSSLFVKDKTLPLSQVTMNLAAPFSGNLGVISDKNLGSHTKSKLKLFSPAKGATIEIDAKNENLTEEGFSVTRLKALAKVESASSKGIMLDITASTPEIFGPIRTTNISGRLSVSLDSEYQPQIARLNHAEVGVFGGTVSASSPRVFPLEENSELLLKVADIEIAELVALYPAGIEGTGKINGTLPLVINSKSVSMQNGELKGSEEGILKYTGLNAGSGGNQNLELVAKALENYHYTNLGARANYSEKGDLHLALQLEGRNPDYLHGRAVHFNLNIEENIPALIKSLSVAKKISGHVSDKINDQFLKK